MKKLVYSLAVLAIVLVFASCNKDDNQSMDTATPNLELRAATLGYTDVETYKANVVAQCAAGNHQNCDIYNDGTHQPCAYCEHAGTNCDGTHHGGSDHGTHGTNGHSHGSHENGDHNGYHHD